MKAHGNTKHVLTWEPGSQSRVRALTMRLEPVLGAPMFAGLTWEQPGRCGRLGLENLLPGRVAAAEAGMGRPSTKYVHKRPSLSTLKALD